MPNKSQEKLKKLEELFRLADSGLTRAEFTDAFAAVVKVIKDTKQGLEDKITKELDSIQRQVDTLSKEVKDDNQKDISDLKGQVSDLVGKALKEQEVGMNFIYDKVRGLKQAEDGVDGEPGASGRDGVDGKTPSETDLKALIEPLIPTVEDIAKQVKVPAPQRIQTPAKAFMIHVADVSSQCNGVNKVFNVGGSHFGIVGVYSTQAPLHFRPVIDYTESRNGFTLLGDAPQTGQSLICQFLK